MDINNVSLTGRLTKDPSITTSQGGIKVAKFSLAVNKTKDQTSFIGIVAFGKTAEIVETYCKSGKKVGIEGSIQTGSYDKDGAKVYTTEVIVSRLMLMDGASNQVDRNQEVDSMIAPQQPANSYTDDLPF